MPITNGKGKKIFTLESEVFTRGVERIIGQDALKTALREGKKLKIKLGIDVTAPVLHIGHAATLWKLREFQGAGHKVQILLGDFTTRIGDPTGRSKTRPVIAEKEIKENARRIRSQVLKILHPQKRLLEIRRNSEWYGKMRITDFLKILSLVTHARLIERDMFKERIRKGEEIYMHELIYPVLQGYDSLMLKSDCTVVGSDQLFNESMGRFIQEKFKSVPQAIVTLTLLPGLDGGEKMSKSAGNYIALLDAPREKFGKAMSLSDNLIFDYLMMYTDVSQADIAKWKERTRRGGNPMQAKLYFAEALVRRYHGSSTARKEREYFLSLFSKKEIPDSVPTLSLPEGEYDALTLVMKAGAAASKSEARRLIGQRAVQINGRVFVSPRESVLIQQGSIIRIGKKKIFKVV